jgi:CHASE2 domain-containing sensor protein
MWGKVFQQSIWAKSALGAGLAVLCGWLLCAAPLGDAWVNASYDYLFRFGSRAVTNQVSLILMDNAAYDEFRQMRGQPWDRALHAQLLNRLADDGCEMVVMDTFFRVPRDPEKDAALAAAMRRQKKLALMAEQSEVVHPTLAGTQPVLPDEIFLQAAQTNWGVAWLNPDPDGIVRRQWPFPNPGPFPSLPWKVAQMAGAKLSQESQERWVRYYGQPGAWTRLSYRFALSKPAGFFRNQIVFIGLEPKTTLADGETDEFSTPYTRWTGETSGGVGILVASFLNLLNDESLERTSGRCEFFVLFATGILLGGGLCRLRLKWTLSIAAGLLLMIPVLAILFSYHTNYWFPWLIVAGGQLPCALACALVLNLHRAPVPGTLVLEPLPETPGYELVHPPFAEGAYGKVWLAKNKTGQWRALKVVYLAKLNNDLDPYEREFTGIQKYQPISDRHPGLLRVEYVSPKQKTGYFYYVMELADSHEPDWQRVPTVYQPRDLVSERALLPGRRLPVKECVRIGIILCEALEFLHQQGLTHRDIKPQNIVYVNGQPKLADLGLITDVRPLGHEGTLVGTPGFMPPAPERPGTISADIYALGMVLYVLCTGRGAALFPEVATTLVSSDKPAEEFLPLNGVILTACQPQPADRYTTAMEMHAALKALQVTLCQNGG